MNAVSFVGAKNGDGILKGRARIDEYGRVILPPSVRETLVIHPGDEFILTVDDDELRISTLKGRIARAQRHARQYTKPGQSIVDEFLAERRAANY